MQLTIDHLNLHVRDVVACRAFYERWFGFALAFEAEGGFFLRNPAGFLLALVPVEEGAHQKLPAGFHIGFTESSADGIWRWHRELEAGGVTVSELEDCRPGEDYVTFRCWDPDGTEIELFWEGAN